MSPSIGIAARVVLGAALTAWLSACDIVVPPPEDRSPRIDVYADRFEYRYGRYESVRSLGIGLEASNEKIARLIVQECEAQPKLPAVLDMLRRRGNVNVEVVIVPKDCPPD